MSDDPALLTLAEALADEPPRPTLIWGDDPRVTPELLPKGLKYDVLADRVADDAPARRVAPLPVPGARYERLCLVMPRSKASLRLRLRAGMAHLVPGGEVWVAGHQQDGIKAVARELGELFGAAEVLRTKRHCRVIGARLVDPPPAELALDEALERFEIPAPRGKGDPLTICSLPGAFSHGRLDVGTQHLINVLEGEHLGFKKGLDMGAGAGVLGAWLKRARPHGKMTLFESSAMACAAAERTLAANDLDATVRLADAASVETEKYDLVVSNPPRHVARAHAHDLTVAFAEHAHRALERNGLFYCVANHSRALTTALEQFFALDVLYHDAAFRVWRAKR